MHHNPCFNLFILHNNSFDNQESEINKNDFFTFRHTVFYKNFLPTTKKVVVYKASEIATTYEKRGKY